jgi:hypothetical protein
MALVARQIGNLNEHTYEITWTSPDGMTPSKTWTVNNAYPSFVENTNEVTQIEINDGIFYDTIMRVTNNNASIIVFYFSAQSQETAIRASISTFIH